MRPTWDAPGGPRTSWTAAELEDARTFPSKIVTEVTKASTFYPAEDYHQKYYFANPGQGYCRAVIRPKLVKLGLKH
jgi:peptide-methionine (S)-S-oxide reductase